VAHPDLLDCGGLSGTPVIMGFATKLVDSSDAPFILTPVSDPELSLKAAWKNYSIIFTEDVGIVIQSADNITNLANYGDGICGNDPKYPGRGLCKKCATQLFATQFDCAGTMRCIFGVKEPADGAKRTLLIGWATGGVVQYAEVKV
jgi:hypothetical protein